MRFATAMFVTALAMPSVHAADYLRGTIPMQAAPQPMQSSSYDWSGVYFGGTGTFGTATFDHSLLRSRAVNAGTPNSYPNSAMTNDVIFNKVTGRKTGWSVMAGYNTMWDDVVLGLEGQYNRLNLVGTSNSGPIGHTMNGAAATEFWDYSISAQAKTRITDYGVIAGRAGWAIDRFMPFASLGLAFGQIATSAGSSGRMTDYLYIAPTTTPTPALTTILSNTSFAGTSKNSGMRWGYAAGLGAEYALLDNVLLRGEWQYLSLGASSGGNINLQTFKAGAAVKF